VLLIAQGDRVLVEQAYGSGNPADSVFRVASLSKTFTAALIENLVRDGKLKLNDSLEQFIPGIPNGSRILVEHLLLHQSGVASIEEPAAISQCLSNDELVAILRRSAPMFEPGKRGQYSNEGYFLLAMIVEKVSGKPYAKFLAEAITGPLRMGHTGSACQDPPGNAVTGMVPGITPGTLKQSPYNQPLPPGAGSIYADAQDLLSWLRAVDTNPSFELTKLKFPYGWGKRNYSGHPLIEQSGMIQGFMAYVSFYPGEHLYTVLLSRVVSRFSNRIPKDMESVLFGGDASRPPEVRAVSMDSSTVAGYAGRFKAESIPVPQVFEANGGNLLMRWGDPFPRYLTPIGPDSFYMRQEYAKVHFERDGNGSVLRAIWQWPAGDPITMVRETDR
jgi:CubicO group peptidase (beta-lactamase class C family)